jgi:OOP family OmpA-OmpF porin
MVFRRLTIKHCALIAGGALLIPALAIAQSQSKNQGYLVDQIYNVVTSATTAICVRTSDWTPARAAAAEACKQCTPDLCPAVAAAPPPSPPPAPAPKPAPPKKETPPPPPPQTISLPADVLFDFNKSTLKPEGKAKLDEMLRSIGSARLDDIRVIGHTDRLGSTTYNQKLSEHRANAVKSYLISKGIAAERIRAEGRGKTQPVTRPADCQGLPRQKLIACLQPDRRVDIETHAQKVSGVDSAHRVNGALCELIKQHERVASPALPGVTKTAAAAQLLTCS